MVYKPLGIVSTAMAASLLVAASCPAEIPNLDPAAAALAAATNGQQVLKLPVRVVDPDGKPVAGAKVAPWALRSSQGHGWWRKDDKRAALDPKEVVTKKDGTATVLYPLYRDLAERIRTLQVSVHVDHPNFAYVDSMHIDVPLETKEPYEIKLEAGAPLEVRPLIDGKPAELNGLLALWSDGRSWLPGSAPEKTPDGTLRFSAMPPGKNSLMLIKLDGEHATHFSKVTYLDLKAGELAKIDVPLLPSQRIEGKLGDNVPRSIQHGRVKVQTLLPSRFQSEQVVWFTWTAVRPDGTFTIEAWPAGEQIQLIALCDGFIAERGKAPDVVETGYDPKKDGYYRPQVFAPTSEAPIEVLMTPRAKCVVTALDQDEKPIAGIKIQSSPNVGWWNWGSQIYAAPLVRGERVLRLRDYDPAIETALPEPFDAETNAQGIATLELPVGNGDLDIESDVYELPAFLGRRSVQIHDLAAAKATPVTLRLQPKGTEKLGEWDKLAGVVFGCSTREGRRICALPEVRKKMDEFAERFREGKNQRDPKLLSEAFNAVADAFVGVGDQEEAAKWRKKAAEQADKVTGNKDPAEKNK